MGWCNAKFKLVDGTDYECRRPAGDNEYCFLHSQDPEKDHQTFVSVVKEALRGESKFPGGLRGAVFFTTEGLFDGHIALRVLLDKAEFHCDADFKDIDFPLGVSFDGAKFKERAVFSGRKTELGEASFRRAHFYGDAQFDGVFFSKRSSFDSAIFEQGADFSCPRRKGICRASFQNVQFKQGAQFTNREFDSVFDISGAEFGLGAETSFFLSTFGGKRDFRSVKFLSDTTFKNAGFGAKPPTRFYNCDLSGLRLLDFGNRTEDIQFHNVTWPKRGFFQGQRAHVADENENPKSLELVRLYRHLQQYYYDQSEFGLSSAFYQGFMIAKRRAEEGNRFGRHFVEGLYSFFSRYGESIWRPLIALLILWLLVPIFLLFMGINLEQRDVEVNYDWFRDGAVGQFMSDYRKAIQWSFSLSTFFRSSELRPPLTSWQHLILIGETILTGLFFSFLVMAIRRRFAPKKPMEVSSTA
ncbi:MAG: pentapeptide repeat-containing protein [bacterium]